MHNTLLADVDLVYGRPPTCEDDLVEIEFADMEPLDGSDLVGVEPLEAIALIEMPIYDLVGVGAHAAIATTPPTPPRSDPFGSSTVPPDELETEEYATWPTS